jgi:spore germination protein KC
MKRLICILICFPLLLAGCWNRREPKNLSLISSALYDLSDDGTYKTILEIINPEAEGGPAGTGDGKSPIITVKGEGGSVPEAIRMTSLSLERSLFAGQTLVRFFTEKFAKNDIISVQDYFCRDPLTDENPFVVVVKGDNPEKIYECKLGLSDNLGNYIDGLKESQHNFISRSVFVDTLTFIKDYLNEGKQPVAGSVEITEEEKQSEKNDNKGTGGGQEKSEGSKDAEKEYKLIYSGLAAFKDKKLVGFMDDKEAGCYNILINNFGNGVVNLDAEGGGLDIVRIAAVKTEVIPVFNGDDLSFDINIRIKTTLTQATDKYDISKPKSLAKISERFNKKMKKIVTSTIEKAQKEFKSDIFGFGTVVHNKHPKKWKELRKNWDDVFTQVKINVSVKSEIRRSGQLKQPLLVKEYKS